VPVGTTWRPREPKGILFPPMTGYAVFPWADASGQPMTFYGRWPAKTVPDDKADKKTQALPGEGTKASPLYIDRDRRAGLKDLVLVEGLIDAALLQAKGEAGVIACMGSQFSALQLETLDHYGVRSVTICLDPDGAGEKGTLACIKGLYGKGINTFVAPVLPESKDPDEYVLAYGLEAWRKHIGLAEHALRYKAHAIVKAHMGEAWTDRSLAACIDEAIAFDAAVKDPERLTDLALFFWPEISHATGADLNAINARREAARDKAEAERERLNKLLRDAGAKLQAGDLNAAKELLREEMDRLRTQERHWKAEPVRNVADELGEHEEWLGRPRPGQMAHRANEGASGRGGLGERRARYLGGAQALEGRSRVGGRYGRGHGSGARNLHAGHGPPSQSVIGRRARQDRPCDRQDGRGRQETT
jgi:DNA primase